MSEVAIPDTLSFDEVVELELLETKIEAGLRTFYEVGDALLEIRDKKLYRQGYAGFDDYCRKKWKFKASRARQLIGAAEVVGNLQLENESDDKSVTIVTLPENEAQARALGQFEPDLQPAIMRVAVARSEALGKPLTAGLIKSVGNTLSEAALTGHVDTGNGESTAFDAAITGTSYEDVQRQRQHISETYDEKNSQGQWKDHLSELSADDQQLVRDVTRDITSGYGGESALQKVALDAKRLSKGDTWEGATPEQKREMLLERFGEKAAKSYERPQSAPPVVDTVSISVEQQASYRAMAAYAPQAMRDEHAERFSDPL